jgi:subtilisin family serine protease
MRKGLALSCLLLVSSVWATPTDLYTSYLEESNYLLLKSENIDPFFSKGGELERRSVPKKGKDGSELLLVQFHQAPTQEALTGFEKQGVEFLRYIPTNSYIIRVQSEAKAGLEKSSLVRWNGPLWAEYRLDPSLAVETKSDSIERVVIFLWDKGDVDGFCERLNGLGVEINGIPTVSQKPMVFASVSQGLLDEIASDAEVEWIEPEPVLTLRNNEETWTVQSGIENNRSIWDKGIMGQGQVIGHLDETLDASSCYFRDNSGNPVGPDHRKLVMVLEPGASESHGTHTAAIAAGRKSDFSFEQAGHAPEARLSHGNFKALIPGRGADVSKNFTDLQSFFEEAQSTGAEIFTNSWGQDGNTRYTYLAQAIDDYTWENEDALVVFAVSNQDHLSSPENSKNVVAVGASYGSSYTGPNGEPGYDVIRSGGQGPTSDGRLKPDLFVPGYEVISAVPGNCVTGAKSGTSMACPVVAGSGALLRQYFMDGFYPTGTKESANGFTPSGALLKAVLLNSTHDMTGVPGYPNIQEGWGRLLLEDAMYFNHDDRYLSVIDNRRSEGDGLRLGEEVVYDLLVEGNTEPLKLTLCWMEPPAAHHASLATINNLDMELVSPDGFVYLGNFFQGGISVPGGEADLLNNLEQILIPNPMEGLWKVRVKGSFVEPSYGMQGYAVVITGDIAMATMRKSFSFKQPQVGPNSGASVVLFTREDPLVWPEVVFTSETGDREVVVMDSHGIGRFDCSVSLEIGALFTEGDGVLSVLDCEIVRASYTDRLQPTFSDEAVVDATPPAVLDFSTSDHRGDSFVVHLEMNEPGSATLQGLQRESGDEFQFSMVPEPGNYQRQEVRVTGLEPATQYSLSFDLNDLVLNSRIDRNGGIGYWVSTWEEVRSWFAGFDSTTNGFISEVLRGSTLWSRRSLSGSPAPWVMHVKTSDKVLDTTLLSPTLKLGSKPDRCLVSFRHQYVFPETQTGGGVLEVPFENGVWIDASGLILDNGYTGTINKTLAVLPNRDAWTGNSGEEWVSTVLDLTAFKGDSFQLRWRLGVDQSEESEFYWYIDEVRLWELAETTPQFTAPINLWFLY